jgi:hypothetical protein
MYASYHSLHPMHCIGIHSSYVHLRDRSRGAWTRGTSGASTSRDRWLRARARQALVHLTKILKFFYSSSILIMFLGACLRPPASLAGSGEKLGTNPWIGQSACCGLCQEPFFSGAMGSIQICRRLVKGCHVQGLPAGSVRWAYVDWRGKHTYHVGRVFPCRVYIDSNRRDSRIWVTACSWQSSRS